MLRMIDDIYETMPWDALDAVVFDVGGVLLAYSPEEQLEGLFPEDETLRAALKRKIIHTPYWNMRDRGTLTLEEAIEAMTGRDGALKADIRRFMENWWRYSRPIREGVDALRACMAQGKRVYVLSNYPAEEFARMEAMYDFFALFDGKIVSSDVHMLKPHEDIYRKLISRFGLDASRTLFIDDTAINIETALHLGWQGLCMNASGKLRAFMQI